MSKTQQEIAAPKACNKIFQNITLTALSIVLTALSTALIYAYQTDMFRQRTAAAIVIITVLSLLLIAAVTFCIIFKTAKTAAVFGFFAVLSLVFILMLVWFETNNPIVAGNLTTAMLMLLLAVAIFALITVLILKTNANRLTVIASLSGCVYAISVIVCFYLANPAFTSARNIVNPLKFSLSVVAALALICVIICIATSKKKVITTKWITYCAMFSALSIVFKIMGNAVSFIPSLKFSLIYLPWIIAGIVLGPSGGMVTALVSDILGQLILPSGFADVNPIVTISNTLFPLFPAILYKYSPLKKDWLNILIGMIFSIVICTLGISSYGIWVRYYKDTDFWVYWAANRLYQPIIIGVNYLIIISLLPVLKRLKLTELTFFEKKTKNTPD